MKFNLQIDWEDADKITVAVLKDLMKDLKAQLKRRKTNKGSAVFDLDKQIDLAEIQKRIDAFDLVLEYFGEIT